MQTYTCVCALLCWFMCVCTCVMNVLHLTAVSILFLLMVGLILHRLPCAGAQGFVAGFVKAVLVLFTWTMPGSLPRHVNQGGDVFTPHKPYSAATYPINTSNSRTFQLRGVTLINLFTDILTKGNTKEVMYSEKDNSYESFSTTVMCKLRAQHQITLKMRELPVKN